MAYVGSQGNLPSTNQSYRRPEWQTNILGDCVKQMTMSAAATHYTAVSVARYRLGLLLRLFSFSFHFA